MADSEMKGLFGRLEVSLNSILENMGTQIDFQEITASASQKLQSKLPDVFGSSSPGPSTGSQEENKGGSGWIRSFLGKLGQTLSSALPFKPISFGGAKEQEKAPQQDKKETEKTSSPLENNLRSILEKLGSSQVSGKGSVQGETKGDAPTEQFSKMLGAFTGAMSKKQEAIDKKFEGLANFAKSDLAKNMGLSKMAEGALLEGKARAGDPVAMATIQRRKKEDVETREKEKHKSVQDSFKAGVGEFKQVFESARATTAAGHALAGVSQFLKHVTPVGSAFAAIGAASFQLVDRIRVWGDRLHSINMQFAEFSGAMASVQARQEVSDIQYSQRQGNMRAATADRLARERNSLRQETEDVESAWGNFTNTVATGFARSIRIANFTARALSGFGGILGAAQQATDASAAEQRTWGAAADAYSREDRDWVERFRAPARFNQNLPATRN